MPRHEICGLFLILAHFLWVSVIAVWVTHVVVLSARIFSSIHGNATVSVREIASMIGGLYFDGSWAHSLQVSCGGGRCWPRGGCGRGKFFAATRNGVAVRVMAFTPNDFWQDTSSSIDKPVAYLIWTNKQNKFKSLSLRQLLWVLRYILYSTYIVQIISLVFSDFFRTIVEWRVSKLWHWLKSVLNWVVPSKIYCYFASAYSIEIVESTLSFPVARHF